MSLVLQSWLGLGNSAEIEVTLCPNVPLYLFSWFSGGALFSRINNLLLLKIVLDAGKRKKAELKLEDGSKEKAYLYYDGETVSGKVHIRLKNAARKLEHFGIKVEFIGQICTFSMYWCAPAGSVQTIISATTLLTISILASMLYFDQSCFVGRPHHSWLEKWK